MDKYKFHSMICYLLRYMTYALILIGISFSLITGHSISNQENISIWVILISIFFTVIVILELLLRITIRLSLPDWAEAKTLAKIIGKMLKDYAKIKGPSGNYPPSWDELQKISPNTKDNSPLFEKDMTFQKEDFRWDAIYDGMRNPPIKFTITVTTPKIFKYNFFAKNKKITYDQDEVIKKYKK